MNPNLGLLVAFVIFGVIDLTFVGLTCLAVSKYLREMDIKLGFITNQLTTLCSSKRDKRNFIVKG